MSILLLFLEDLGEFILNTLVCLIDTVFTEFLW